MINSLTKDVVIENEKNSSKKVNIMSKQNTKWIGKIANEKLQITNNRLSQQEAYEYLSKECNLNDIKKSLIQI